MKKLIIVPLLFLFVIVRAQGPSENPGNLPSIIPPSPDVASLAKIGNLSAGLHTGSANVNIPLYEISVGSIKIPVALSYSTNGTRTNEIPSRVGLNWNLVAGGSISRVIHDEEDGGTSTIPLAFPTGPLASQAGLDYVFYANQEYYDTEADEYSFSVNGMSGKFFIDNTGAIRVADHSNVRITKDANSFTLITADGIKYEFGKNLEIEKTRDVKTNGNLRAHKIKTTAWFLTRITSPEGDQANFSYTPIYTKTQLGPYQSVILKTLAPNYPYVNSDFTDCASLCQGQWSSVQYNKVDYDTYYLSSIGTTDGQQVYFIYQDRPDAGGDNRLLYVNVYTTNDAAVAKLIRKYQFEYEDRPVGNDLNQRFFLKKLYTQSTGSENPQTILMHQFDYNDPSTLGSQESLLQDYYGYSKGNGSQPSNFFPKPVDWASYENGSLGTDRTPDFEATKAGTLQKVTYPTGGYEEFIYEPHTIPQYTTTTDSVFSNTSISGVGLNYSSVNTYTRLLTVNSAPMRISYTTEWNPNGPAPGTPSYYTPDDIHFISYLEIWKLSTNTMVFEDRHKNYGTTNTFPQLEPGVQYEIRLKVVGNSHFSIAQVFYNPVVQSTTTYTNISVCGLRVQKINAYDPVSNKVTTKFYKYASVNDLNLSSGVGMVQPTTTSAYQGGGSCLALNQGNGAGEVIFECPGGLLQVSSSSLSESFTFSGSPIAYTHVIESDDAVLANGGIEHNFYTYHNPQQPSTVLNYQIAGASSAGPFPDMNGVELQTTTFKKSGVNLITLRKTVNTYSYDSRVGYTLSNYVTRKRWNQPGQSNWTYTDRLKGYDIGGYLYMSKWLHLDNTVTTEYDQNGANPLTQTVTYTYDNTVHLQPTQVTTSNSKGETIVQQMKYPADFTDAVYTGMVTKNIITPVIESNSTNNSIAVSTVRSEFASWQSGSFYKPQLVKLKKGTGTLEDRLRYYSYDLSGNPLEVSKENGQRISYIWNYQKAYPVAEVKNASPADIAYTSFEGDDNGGWNYDRANILPTGITGEKSFNGTLWYTVNPATTYMVTLWIKVPETPTVNGAAGQLLITRNGWSLYKWTMSGAGTITVAGKDIDEVRLHPAGAQMTTYTYLPFIGISTVSDANNSILKYSYDGLNRLLLVRDLDNNILKQYDYKYNQSIVPCANTAVNWQPTGKKSCVMTANGNYTGEQQKEERDMNTCSPTYLQTRWISLGVTGQCQPIPNCDGADKRVVNGVCETGTKILISSSWTGTQWRCVYKYVWSDGYESHQFIEYSSTQCTTWVEW